MGNALVIDGQNVERRHERSPRENLGFIDIVRRSASRVGRSDVAYASCYVLAFEHHDEREGLAILVIKPCLRTLQAGSPKIGMYLCQRQDKARSVLRATPSGDRTQTNANRDVYLKE